MTRIPAVRLSSGHGMPVMGYGTAAFPPAPPEVLRAAISDVISLGYRQFDRASVYGTEEPLGDAIAGAIKQGLVKREDRRSSGPPMPMATASSLLLDSLLNLKLEYVDLYLVFGRVPKTRPCKVNWSAVIFSDKRLEYLLSFVTIPPAVNQVEMNPRWQQKRLMEFCKKNGILLCAYSPLGSTGNTWGSNQVLECEVLKQRATSKAKSVGQVSLRWLVRARRVFKIYKKERLKEKHRHIRSLGIIYDR